MRKYEVDMTMEPSRTAAMAGGGAEEAAIEMQCAGCGSKIGHSVLKNALGRLESVEHHGVLIGLDAPDDAAVVEVPPGKLAVHTVDFFPALVDDAFIFGRIAANHALSDIYAMGATPHTALAVVTLPHGTEQEQEDLLADVLGGALQVLMPAQTAGEALAKYSGAEYSEPEEVVTGRWAEHLRTVPPGMNYKAHTAWAGHPHPAFVTETRFWHFLLKLHPDQSSWTIAASPGPWTGPFHWESRRLRTPELAALQGFPPDYHFCGTRRERVRQIGNAMPAPLASALLAPLLEALVAVPCV